MLELVTTGAFRKDLKLVKKRGYDLSLLETVLNALLEEKTLDQRYHDHALTGNYIGFRECHILPDWLLIYAVNKITADSHSFKDGNALRFVWEIGYICFRRCTFYISPPYSTSFILKEIFFLATSTDKTFTFTISPSLTTSKGCFTNFLDRAEICTRPS